MRCRLLLLSLLLSVNLFAFRNKPTDIFDTLIPELPPIKILNPEETPSFILEVVNRINMVGFRQQEMINNRNELSQAEITKQIFLNVTDLINCQQLLDRHKDNTTQRTREVLQPPVNSYKDSYNLFLEELKRDLPEGNRDLFNRLAAHELKKNQDKEALEIVRQQQLLARIADFKKNKERN